MAGERLLKAIRNPQAALRFGVRTAGRYVNYGTSPFEHDWDVFVVLDACRFDLFEQFAPEHPLYGEFRSVAPRYSCGSSTAEWIVKTCARANDEQLAGTAYVHANGKINSTDRGENPEGDIDLSRFDTVEDVSAYAHRSDLGTTPPEPVTNAAIRTHRADPDRRLLVHYVQPHVPFIHCPDRYGGFGRGQVSVWRGLERGEYDVEEVWQDYGRNLLTVLNSVETLVDNVKGDVVVSSDHGNLFDDYGLGLYSHPSFVPLPKAKRVPWARIQGKGRSTYEVRPNEVFESTEETTPEDRLRDLGYVD